MNFLIPKDIKSKQAFVKKAEEKQEYKLVGSMKYRPGLILYEYNTDTDELIRIKIKKEITIDYKTQKEKKKMSIQYKKNCWYFFSLNDKNARRKINNLLQTIKKQIDV